MKARTSWSRWWIELRREDASARGHLIAGEIGKPHGIRGDVYVVAISDDPHRFAPGSELIHADGRHLIVENSRRHANRLLVKFEGIDTRDAAETLKGGLFVAQEHLRQLDQGEFWEHELIGCKVRTVDGEKVGEIDRIIPGAAQDLLAISTPVGERLVPLVKEIVVMIDPAGREVIVDAPEGLL